LTLKGRLPEEGRSSEVVLVSVAISPPAALLIYANILFVDTTYYISFLQLLSRVPKWLLLSETPPSIKGSIHSWFLGWFKYI